MGPLELVGVVVELPLLPLLLLDGGGGGGGDSILLLRRSSLVWEVVEVADDMEFVRFGGCTIIDDCTGIASLVNMELVKAQMRFYGKENA